MTLQLPAFASPTLYSALFGITGGVGSHLLFFKHGEHHMQAPMIVKMSLVSIAYLIIVCLLVNFEQRKTLLRTVGTLTSCYLGSLFASITVYRLFFHQLRSFPGPKMAAVSKLWHAWKVGDNRNHDLLEKLRAEYGSFVRTGPSEVTIFSPNVLPLLDGPKNTCTKSPWYDVLVPLKAVNSVRSKAEHDQRKWVWNLAMSTKATQSYDPSIKYCAHNLDEYIQRARGESIHMNDCIYWYAFDIMGELTFAKSFNMLVQSQWHHAVILMRKFMVFFGPLSPLPWMMRIGYIIPRAGKDWKVFLKWCADRMDERISLNYEKEDVSHHLIKASTDRNTLAKDLPWLHGDVMSLVIAGSDTVGTTLMYLLYHLAAFPHWQDALFEEFDKLDSIEDIDALMLLPQLKSVILETLRLFPPVPTSALRDTGPEGLYVDGVFIPPYTTIQAPRFSIARLDSAFVHPYDFVPERWTSRPELILNKRAFAPFNQGRYGCAGKKLTWREMSYVMALLVRKYEFEFAPGFDPERIKTEMKDEFTAVPGPLDMIVKERSQAA